MLGTVCTTINVCEGHPEFWSLHRHRLMYFTTVLNRTIDIVQVEMDIKRTSATLYDGVIRVEFDVDGDVTFTSRSCYLRKLH